MRSPSSELVETAARLAREVAEHKAAIGHHRRKLQRKSEALAEIRRRCAALGIGVTVVAPRGDHSNQEM